MSSPSQITPSIFVGSSKEGLSVAQAIEFNLHDDAEVTLWSHGVFGPTHSYLESLVTALDRFDFAVLALTPDDFVMSRNQVASAARDNVMFELGLFMGRLGRKRTFAVCSDDPSMQLPSDLAGVSVLKYNANRSDGNIEAATSPACTQIRKIIKSLGVSDNRVVKRLTAATKLFEGVSSHAERMIHLMAQSRILELEVIHRQFGSALPDDIQRQLIEDLNRLKEETTTPAKTGLSLG